MRIYSHLEEIANSRLNKPIVTWGVFDGVHLGHQKLLGNLVKWAKEIKGTSVVLTFPDPPRKILNSIPLKLIMPLSDRILFLKQLGIDVVVVLSFTPQFSQLTPEEFIRQIIYTQIKAYGIVASPKTRFGHQQKGDINLLRKLCSLYHIRLKTVKEKLYQGKPISSSAIRQAIQKGDLAKTKAMLGRNFTMKGTVVQGSGRGRLLGIPTANLKLEDILILPRGVYACKAKINKKTYQALTNIGYRPTFEHPTKILDRKTPPHSEMLVEVHLLRFRPTHYQNLYGKEMEVEILKRLRDEKKFPDAKALIRQIEQDKKYFL